MVRAPCCEKMGLKKGPWTVQEDEILVKYIHRYGHGNWRALPKHAGLLRCGKSCRLRWTNYLRPDIKRGNFTREEEDAIINLHQALGNRWSAIAARLPGRTDNEIKNVWHTHLKKRLNTTINTDTKTQTLVPQHSKSPDLPKKESPATIRCCSTTSSSNTSTLTTTTAAAAAVESTSSPQPSCSGTTSNHSTTTNFDSSSKGGNKVENLSDLQLGEDFWADVLSAENIVIDQTMPNSVAAAVHNNDVEVEHSHVVVGEDIDYHHYHNDMDFWYNLLTRAAAETTHQFMEF